MKNLLLAFSLLPLAAFGQDWSFSGTNGNFTLDALGPASLKVTARVAPAAAPPAAFIETIWFSDEPVLDINPGSATFSYTNTLAAGDSWTISWSGSRMTDVTVEDRLQTFPDVEIYHASAPEPSTLALGACAAMAVWCARKRK